MSFLFPYLNSTDALCSRLGDLAPSPPKWRPYSQGPRTLPYRDRNTKHLCSKLSKSLYCINRAKNFLTKKALKTLYFSLIHSHLSYCTPNISCSSNSNILTIFKMQKKAIRTITKNNYLAHTNPLFLEQKIVPFPKLITYPQLKLMHSIVYSYCSPTLWSIFRTNNQREVNHDLRNADLFTIPHPRIELF
jgi:hypothetical protein